jgi:hypothetical protein
MTRGDGLRSGRPDQTANFSWEAITSSHDFRYWQLGWQLVALQRDVIASVLAAKESTSRRTKGQRHIVLMDLAVDDELCDWLDYLGDSTTPSHYLGCRNITQPAVAATETRLQAGTSLSWDADIPDRMWEGLGLTLWGDQERHAWYASALEGRWGCAAVLADALIVPETALGDTSPPTELVGRLVEVTVGFRREHGLAPEGAEVDPAIAEFVGSLRSIDDATRGRLEQNSVDLQLERVVGLPPEVYAAGEAAAATLARARHDGSGPVPDGFQPFRHAGEAARAALLAAFADNGVDRATRNRLVRPWLSVGLAVPAPKQRSAVIRVGQTGLRSRIDD